MAPPPDFVLSVPPPRELAVRSRPVPRCPRPNLGPWPGAYSMRVAAPPSVPELVASMLKWNSIRGGGTPGPLAADRGGLARASATTDRKASDVWACMRLMFIVPYRRRGPLLLEAPRRSTAGSLRGIFELKAFGVWTVPGPLLRVKGIFEPE